MSSQLFFLLNLLFGIVFLIWFFSARKDGTQKPTPLNLRAGQPEEGTLTSAPPPSRSMSSAASATPPATKSASPKAVFVRASEEKPPEPKIEIKPAQPIAEKERKTKTLNVLFLYNGHDWDAYQVLGLPAGTSLAMVTDRYQQLVKGVEGGQLEFYEAAYQAILKKV